ncbi:MAG: FAD-binding oxidoreductase [Dehalococcoidia bacterium]|nr:FAD-binding oxidoreductase [Dehalococcoidia bacterium]
MSLVDELRTIVGDDFVVTRRDQIQQYLLDETPQAVKPVAADNVIVVKPASASQVSEIVKLANRTLTPLFPRGGGTSTVGGPIPTVDGIVLSLERLDRLIEVDMDNLMVVAEAGVTMETMLRTVEAKGLLFPPHPGDEGAQVGGVIACNAGGSRAVKYGIVRNYVKGLEVVLPTGEIVSMGGKLLKNNTGLDLLHLMIGSEGTLGVITKAVFRLYPKPAVTAVLLVSFDARHPAVAAVPKVLQAGIIPLAIEYVERDIIEISARHLGLSWPARKGDAHLIFTVDGNSEEQVYDLCERIAEVCDANGAVDTLFAETRQEQGNILKMRNELYGALMPDLAESLDLAVPPARVADFLDAVDRIALKYGSRIPNYGHAADGNLHPHLMMDLQQRGLLWQVKDDIYEQGARLGGIVTAEHGVGRSRRLYFDRYTDETSKRLMRGVKQLFDPNNILNPGAALT